MKKQSRLPACAALASLLSAQIGAAFAKTIFPLVGPEGVAALRIGIAAALLCLMLRPWTLSIARGGWRDLVIYGVMLGLMNILIYRAFAYIPVGIAISIEVLGPLGAALLASRRRLDWLWAALALIGLVLLPLGSLTGPLDVRGVAYALAAALCWGMYVSYGGRVAGMGACGVAVAVGMTLAAIFLVPLGVLHAGSALLAPHVLAFGLVVALLSSAFPFLLDIYALRNLPTSVFGILMSASPAVSAVAGFVVLHEALGRVQWLGILAITAACLGCAVAAVYRPALRHAMVEA